MATVVNQPDTANSAGMGMMIGAILLIVVVLAVFFYGIPMMRQQAPAQVPAVQNNTMPAPAESSGTDINIPDKIDVNVNQDGGSQSNPPAPAQ